MQTTDFTLKKLIKHLEKQGYKYMPNSVPLLSAEHDCNWTKEDVEEIDKTDYYSSGYGDPDNGYFQSYIHFTLDKVDPKFEYFVISIPDEECYWMEEMANPKYKRDLGYSVHHYEDMVGVYEGVSILACGGHYTCLGIFDRNGTNLTREYYTDHYQQINDQTYIKTIIPNGSDKAIQENSDSVSDTS